MAHCAPTSRRRRRRAAMHRRCVRGSSATASHAPVFTLPTCAHTIAGPPIDGSASTRIRPCSSAGTLITRLRPSPRSPSDLINVGCASAPMTTVIGGAPNNPSASTFHPTRFEHRMSRRGQRDEIRDRRAGDERAAAGARQIEHLEQPAQRRLLQPRRRRRDVVQAGVLIPRRRQPVRRQRNRQRSADDETEEARAGHRHRRGRCIAVEQVDHGARIGRFRPAVRRRGADSASHAFASGATARSCKLSRYASARSAACCNSGFMVDSP